MVLSNKKKKSKIEMMHDKFAECLTYRSLSYKLKIITIEKYILGLKNILEKNYAID